MGPKAKLGRAHMGPGPKGAGPKRDLGPNGPGPNGIQAQTGRSKWDPGPEPFRGGFLGKNWSRGQNRHGHVFLRLSVY